MRTCPTCGSTTTYPAATNFMCDNGHVFSWTAEAAPRARDFVKCADPECGLNKTWARRCKEYGWTADDYKPHCHPIF